MMIEDYKAKQKQEINIWKPCPTPKSTIDLARRRTRGILHYSILTTTPLQKLINSAYLQGVIDGYETATGETK